jgi:hypothetical protein
MPRVCVTTVAGDKQKYYVLCAFIASVIQHAPCYIAICVLSGGCTTVLFSHFLVNGLNKNTIKYVSSLSLRNVSHYHKMYNFTFCQKRLSLSQNVRLHFLSETSLITTKCVFTFCQKRLSLPQNVSSLSVRNISHYHKIRLHFLSEMSLITTKWVFTFCQKRLSFPQNVSSFSVRNFSHYRNKCLNFLSETSLITTKYVSSLSVRNTSHNHKICVFTFYHKRL